jgi:hypothetical protein
MIGELISPERRASLVAHGQQPPSRWLQLDPEVVGAAYNHRPFLLKHRLPEHPLFSSPSPVFALCRRLPPVQVKHRFGVIPSDADFDTSLTRYQKGLTLDDAIDRFEELQAYIAIYNPERDPEYRAAIEGFLGEIAASLDPVDPGMNWYSTYIFLTAQGSVTPYHMDREMNFLLQVLGTKTVRLWDPADEEVMSGAEKDELLARTAEHRPPYRPSLDSKAMVYELQPGLGVHHPFIAPHLVHTGPEVSISLAITFRTRSSDIWTDAHRLNHHLRRLGVHPGPVRRSETMDRVKAETMRIAVRARSWLRRPGDDPA